MEEVEEEVEEVEEVEDVEEEVEVLVKSDKSVMLAWPCVGVVAELCSDEATVSVSQSPDLPLCGPETSLASLRVWYLSTFSQLIIVLDG